MTGRRAMIALALALPMLGATGCGYNTIQTYDEQVEAARGRIEVQLQRRLDLVPNLVRTVERFAQQERDVFVGVAQARSALQQAVQTGDVGQIAAANQQLTGALGRLIAVAEAYPQLRSDQSFIRLQDELAGTENRIAVARQDYNEAVRLHNAYIRRFPQTLTARVIGAEQHEYFEADPAAQRAPTVEFSQPPAGGG